MKIYFGASISLNRDFLPKYQQIVKTIKQLGHEVLSEYVVDPKLKIGLGLTPEKLFTKETKTIEKADLMIAEVTVPSWDTAFLMEHALKRTKPVLALYYKDNGNHIPMMIAGHPKLYADSYDEDNLTSILRTHLRHFNLMKKNKGKLIVIDGINGSGKETQTKLLLQYLRNQNITANFISFPRYHTSFHGKTVSRFLSGEFGKLNDVNPYLSSLAFALDRLTAKNQIIDWLNDGHIVLADRYVTSSLAHQGAKLALKDRQKFSSWIYEMEYQQHKMPKENMVIFLYVPAEISDKLMQQRNGKHEGKKDIEEGLAYQKKVAKYYLQLCLKFKHWEIINCVLKNGELKSRETIHQEIINLLKNKKII